MPEVRALLMPLLDVRTEKLGEILKWSKWRQDRNHRAAVSHRKWRLAEHGCR